MIFQRRVQISYSVIILFVKISSLQQTVARHLHRANQSSPFQYVQSISTRMANHFVNSLIQYVEKQLYLLEERMAIVTVIANQQLENLRAKSERLVERLFEESSTCYVISHSCINILNVLKTTALICLIKLSCNGLL